MSQIAIAVLLLVFWFDAFAIIVSSMAILNNIFDLRRLP